MALWKVYVHENGGLALFNEMSDYKSNPWLVISKEHKTLLHRKINDFLLFFQAQISWHLYASNQWVIKEKETNKNHTDDDDVTMRIDNGNLDVDDDHHHSSSRGLVTRSSFLDANICGYRK